jgi:hypothetical protein
LSERCSHELSSRCGSDELFMKRLPVYLIVLAGLLATSIHMLAQTDQRSSQATKDTRLRLLLVRSEERGSLASEEKLTIRFLNEGETTYRFPEPAKLCSSMDGFVMVYKQVLVQSHPPELGRGCSSAGVPRTDVLSAAKKWKTFAPGDMYDVVMPLRGPLLLDPDNTYELRARYCPAHFSKAELSALATNGITVLQETLESPSIFVESQSH